MNNIAAPTEGHSETSDLMTAEDWKAMYLLLARGIRDASDLLPRWTENEAALRRLSLAMQTAEERYRSAGED